MIEFKGVVSEQVRIDRMHRVNKLLIIPLIVFFIASTVLLVISAVNKADIGIYLSIVYDVATLVIFVMMYLLPTENRLTYPHYLSNEIQIVIAKSKICHSYFKKTKPIEDVKRVVDVGEWYYIVFKYGDIGNAWICQKDLLMQGTVSDFEKIFEGKICHTSNRLLK